mgnify:CR=1 FL=1
MTVSATIAPAIIPWRSHPDEDESLPAYRWMAGQSLTGGVGAGVVFTDIILEATAKATSRLFTIEDVSIARLDNVLDSALIRLVGFDQESPSAPQFTRAEEMGLTGANTAFAAFSLRSRPLRFPFHHRRGVDLTLTLHADTETNTVTYTFWAWGWIWEAQSFHTPTGPRKPW